MIYQTKYFHFFYRRFKTFHFHCLQYLALALDTYAEAGYGDSIHWQEALEQANRVLQQNPFDPQVLVVHGDHAKIVEKDFVIAAGYFGRALDVAPGDARVHQAIAERHLRTGDIPTGIEDMRQVRILEPEHKVERWVETKYLAASTRLEDARLAAEELMAMYTDFPYIQNFYWQYYLSMGDHNAALEAIPKHTAQWRIDYMRAMVVINAGDFYHPQSGRARNIN